MSALTSNDLSFLRVKDDLLFRPAPSPENRLQVMPDQVEMLLLALQQPDGPLLLRKLSEKDPFVTA